MRKSNNDILEFLGAIYIIYFVYSIIEHYNTHPITLTLICIFALIYFADVLILKGKLSKWGTGKSFDNMSNTEWYRLVTSSFFHMNLLHMMANLFAIYFVGSFLEDKLGSGLFLLIYMVGNLLVSLLFSTFSSFTDGTGASPGIFALVGCILYLYIQTPELVDLKFGTWQTNYIILYSTLGNLIGLGGAISHVLGFIFGILMSTLLF
ncbi:rhomboid family intramembrane serine protease [Solibacillus sp. CAU 1738]|uniref:rhomboid family intramembrane serine protease n=1 Tax=Solibacillus sp. CAU 1738 TaxID=3140363 RepID=UPI0032617706